MLGVSAEATSFPQLFDSESWHSGLAAAIHHGELGTWIAQLESNSLSMQPGIIATAPTGIAIPPMQALNHLDLHQDSYLSHTQQQQRQQPQPPSNPPNTTNCDVCGSLGKMAHKGWCSEAVRARCASILAILQAQYGKDFEIKVRLGFAYR